MIIQLMPQDIPQFWEAIKFTCKNADEVNEKDFPAYANELLIALLTEKAQCFVRLDDKRILHALVVTRVYDNKLTNEKYLFVQSLYAWTPTGTGEWTSDLDFIVQFAKSAGCAYIKTQSRHERVYTFLRSIGFSEESRTFLLRM